MQDLIAARSTMAFSLGFHIIFACIGMTMPFLMSIAHYKYLRTREHRYLLLTKMWMKGVAILFAVGAVSGTVLSFELGLLWPGFMKHAGPIIGMPFSWEGTAFFLEAIAIGLFLYGWDKMTPWVHWATGLVVGISGFASGIFVVAANSWMNSPAGFEWSNGVVSNVDPVAAMFNKAWLHQSLHMQVAALQSVGFAVAGIHAYLILKNKATALHMSAFKIAMVVGGISALGQPLIGHFSAQQVAVLQPVKLAAMEGHFKTSAMAPLYIGGIPNEDTQTMDWGIAIPGALSFLAFNSPHAEVAGLDQVTKELWPPVAIVHIAFQIMVALGTLMAALSALFFYFLYRNKFPSWFLKILILSIPVGFVAVEAGWVVTEVGRQPWIIYNVMKTADAVSPIPGMQYHFYLFVFVYLILGITTAWLLQRQIIAAQKEEMSA